MRTSFKDWFMGSSAARRFALFGLILCIAYYILETINGRSQMADFRVYYDAASAFKDHTQLYGKAFGVSSGFYKYSPFACIPFVTFSLLDYGVASLLYYLVLSIIIVGFSLWISWYVIAQGQLKTGTGIILILVTLFMADHIERELHLGNVNLFLLAGACMVFLWKERHLTAASVCYAIMLLFKPHFLVLLPYFIWKKNFKLIGLTSLFIAAGLFIPVLFYGWEGNLDLLRQWLAAIRDHNVELFESPNTIYGIFNHFVLGGNGGLWLVLAMLLIVASGFLLLMRRNRLSGAPGSGFIEFFCIVALIPNLAHTDTEHFMWTWPLVAFSINWLVQARFRGRMILIILMVLAFIPYCLNSPDIVGKKLRFLFDEGGLLGIANLVVIGIAIYLHLRLTEKNQKIMPEGRQALYDNLPTQTTNH